MSYIGSSSSSSSKRSTYRTSSGSSYVPTRRGSSISSTSTTSSSLGPGKYDYLTTGTKRLSHDLKSNSSSHSGGSGIKNESIEDIRRRREAEREQRRYLSMLDFLNFMLILLTVILTISLFSLLRYGTNYGLGRNDSAETGVIDTEKRKLENLMSKEKKWQEERAARQEERRRKKEERAKRLGLPVEEDTDAAESGEDTAYDELEEKLKKKREEREKRKKKYMEKVDQVSSCVELLTKDDTVEDRRGELGEAEAEEMETERGESNVTPPALTKEEEDWEEQKQKRREEREKRRQERERMKEKIQAEGSPVPSLLHPNSPPVLESVSISPSPLGTTTEAQQVDVSKGSKAVGSTGAKVSEPLKEIQETNAVADGDKKKKEHTTSGKLGEQERRKSKDDRSEERRQSLGKDKEEKKTPRKGTKSPRGGAVKGKEGEVTVEPKTVKRRTSLQNLLKGRRKSQDMSEGHKGSWNSRVFYTFVRCLLHLLSLAWSFLSFSLRALVTHVGKATEASVEGDEEEKLLAKKAQMRLDIEREMDGGRVSPPQPGSGESSSRGDTTERREKMRRFGLMASIGKVMTSALSPAGKGDPKSARDSKGPKDGRSRSGTVDNKDNKRKSKGMDETSENCTLLHSEKSKISSSSKYMYIFFFFFSSLSLILFKNSFSAILFQRKREEV